MQKFKGANSKRAHTQTRCKILWWGHWIRQDESDANYVPARFIFVLPPQHLHLASMFSPDISGWTFEYYSTVRTSHSYLLYARAGSTEVWHSGIWNLCQLKHATIYWPVKSMTQVVYLQGHKTILCAFIALRPDVGHFSLKMLTRCTTPLHCSDTTCSS